MPDSQPPDEMGQMTTRVLWLMFDHMKQRAFGLHDDRLFASLANIAAQEGFDASNFKINNGVVEFDITTLNGLQDEMIEVTMYAVRDAPETRENFSNRGEAEERDETAETQPLPLPE